MLDHRVAKLGMTFAEFAERHPYHMREPGFRKYERTGFATPSGKVELVSSVLEGLGFDPLPYWRGGAGRRPGVSAAPLHRSSRRPVLPGPGTGTSRRSGAAVPSRGCSSRRPMRPAQGSRTADGRRSRRGRAGASCGSRSATTCRTDWSGCRTAGGSRSGRRATAASPAPGTTLTRSSARTTPTSSTRSRASLTSRGSPCAGAPGRGVARPAEDLPRNRLSDGNRSRWDPASPARPDRTRAMTPSSGQSVFGSMGVSPGNERDERPSPGGRLDDVAASIACRQGGMLRGAGLGRGPRRQATRPRRRPP